MPVGSSFCAMTQGNQGYGQPDPYSQQPGQYGQPAQGGPSYANPQYGPGSYGRPPSGAAGGRPRKRFGLVGLVLSVVGAAAVVVAFLASIDWGKSSNTTYSKIHDLLSGAPSDQVTTLAKLYFSWLGWVLLAAAFVLALLAALPTPAAGVLRTLGLLVGLGGAVVTFFAIKLATDAGFIDYLKTARVGFYLAIAGFVVIAIGALIGARKA